MLSADDASRLTAQITQFADEQEEYGGIGLSANGSWDQFIAWRQAVALELQAEALWEANGGEDDAEEPKRPWEE